MEQFGAPSHEFDLPLINCRIAGDFCLAGDDERVKYKASIVLGVRLDSRAARWYWKTRMQALALSLNLDNG
jgi:hypothetical protein